MKIDNITCERCASRSLGIFKILKGEKSFILNSKKTTFEYPKGHILFSEGNPAQSIFCIHSGLVKLCKTGRSGEEIVLNLSKSGDVIGQRAIIADEPYAVTAQVVQKSVICTISKADLGMILEESPDIYQNIMLKFAQDIRISEEKLLSRSQESVRQRTSRILLEFNEMSGGDCEKGVKISIPVLKSEMAQMIGTTAETFSRTLHYFAQRGLIKLTRKEISVLQPSAMKLMIKQ